MTVIQQGVKPLRHEEGDSEMKFFDTTLVDGTPAFISSDLNGKGVVFVRAHQFSGAVIDQNVRMSIVPEISSCIVCARCIADKTTALYVSMLVFVFSES